MSKILFSYHDLIKKFNNKIINYESHSFTEKTITVIYGESGKGKSTLLKIIAGIEKYDGGNLLFASNIIQIKDIGILLQKIILPTITVKELIDNNIQHTKENNITNQLLSDLIRDIDKNQLTTELSGGQQVRMMLYVLFHSEKKILLLDEPLAHQDAKNINIIINILLEVKKTKTIVISSHEKISIEDEAINV